MGAKVWKRADTGPAQPPVPGAEQLVAGPSTSSQKLPIRRASNTQAPSGHPVGNAGAPHRPTQAHQKANTAAHHAQRSQPAHPPRHRGPPTQRPRHPRQPAASGDPGTSSQPHHTAKPRRSTDAEGPPHKRQRTEAAPEKQQQQQQQQQQEKQQEKPKAEQPADPLARAKIEAEIAMLRRQLAERQREAELKKRTAEQARLAKQQAARKEQEALQQKREKISAGFKAAFEEAAEEKGRQQAEAVRQVATEADVKRVMACTSDYDVLQVSAGSGRALVKERYKEMARLLHPDKCKEPEATEAFQRVARAYQNLIALMA